MKSASVALASLLFGSFAVAAPFDRRDLKTKTNLVTETVIVYTTVWEDEDPAPTSVDGLFYEQPPTTVITATEAPPAPAAPTSTPAAAPAPAAQPETTQAPAAAPAAPAPEPVTSAAPAPAAQPESQAPQQQQDTQPASQPSSQPASQPASSSSGSSSSGGATYTDVDITIYDNNGGYGACGTELHDSDMIVALAQSAWGSSTYDVMTGAATNPWCGQKIKIDYNGNSIEATIMDMCPGCSGHDIDLSLSAWKALTGMDEKTRLKASWSKA